MLPKYKRFPELDLSALTGGGGGCVVVIGNTGVSLVLNRLGEGMDSVPEVKTLK